MLHLEHKPNVANPLPLPQPPDRREHAHVREVEDPWRYNTLQREEPFLQISHYRKILQVLEMRNTQARHSLQALNDSKVCLLQLGLAVDPLDLYRTLLKCHI